MFVIYIFSRLRGFFFEPIKLTSGRFVGLWGC
jgi:hypothetical protein